MLTKMKSFSRRGGGGVDEGSGPLGRSRGENVYQNQSQTICMSHGEGGKHHPAMLILLGIALLTLLLSACSGPSSSNPSSTNNTTGGGTISFPTTGTALRTPAFGTQGQVAPTVKVLASAAPTLIIQFPLFPASIKPLFPDATALATVLQANPQPNAFDTVIVPVQKIPPTHNFPLFFP